MEFFLPSLLIFLIATVIIVFLLPKLSPLIIVTFAAILMTLGIYHHFKLFWNEYRQSTWQDQLKLFAPGIMLAVIIVYILFAILMFFTGGKVPIPEMPKFELPPANTATNGVTSAINSVLQTVTPNTMKTNNTGNTNTNTNTTTNTKRENNTNKKNNNVTRSFLATI